MKARQYLLIILALFAISYTTTDRWSDTAELITPDTIQASINMGVNCTNSILSPHIELFCEFPMVAKIIVAFCTTFLSLLSITFFFAARLNEYPQERFRPPALITA